MKKIAMAFAGFSLLFSLSQASHAEKMLSGDEIKALITGKTIYVIQGNGAQFRVYHAADGSSVKDDGEPGTWKIEDDNHCNTGAKAFPCTPIRDNGDGTYARVKPNGSPAVTWTKIIDGKEF